MDIVVCQVLSRPATARPGRGLLVMEAGRWRGHYKVRRQYLETPAGSLKGGETDDED